MQLHSFHGPVFINPEMLALSYVICSNLVNIGAFSFLFVSKLPKIAITVAAACKNAEIKVAASHGKAHDRLEVF